MGVDEAGSEESAPRVDDLARGVDGEPAAGTDATVGDRDVDRLGPIGEPAAADEEV